MHRPTSPVARIARSSRRRASSLPEITNCNAPAQALTPRTPFLLRDPEPIASILTLDDSYAQFFCDNAAILGPDIDSNNAGPSAEPVSIASTSPRVVRSASLAATPTTVQCADAATAPIIAQPTDATSALATTQSKDATTTPATTQSKDVTPTPATTQSKDVATAPTTRSTGITRAPSSTSVITTFTESIDDISSVQSPPKSDSEYDGSVGAETTATAGTDLSREDTALVKLVMQHTEGSQEGSQDSIVVAQVAGGSRASGADGQDHEYNVQEIYSNPDVPVPHETLGWLPFSLAENLYETYHFKTEEQFLEAAKLNGWLRKKSNPPLRWPATMIYCSLCNSLVQSLGKTQERHSNSQMHTNNLSARYNKVFKQFGWKCPHCHDVSDTHLKHLGECEKNPSAVLLSVGENLSDSDGAKHKSKKRKATDRKGCHGKRSKPSDYMPGPQHTRGAGGSFIQDGWPTAILQPFNRGPSSGSAGAWGSTSSFSRAAPPEFYVQTMNSRDFSFQPPVPGRSHFPTHPMLTAAASIPNLRDYTAHLSNVRFTAPQLRHHAGLSTLPTWQHRPHMSDMQMNHFQYDADVSNYYDYTAPPLYGYMAPQGEALNTPFGILPSGQSVPQGEAINIPYGIFPPVQSVPQAQSSGALLSSSRFNVPTSGTSRESEQVSIATALQDLGELVEVGSLEEDWQVLCDPLKDLNPPENE